MCNVDEVAPTQINVVDTTTVVAGPKAPCKRWDQHETITIVTILIITLIRREEAAIRQGGAGTAVGLITTNDVDVE